MEKALWERPVFFKRNRVFRVYLGGQLLGRFVGESQQDGFYPEEWIASSVHALNPDSADPLEGISIAEGTDIPFDRLLREHPAECLGNRKELGVLVKYLDSAVRLPMQVHPTREFSRKHFGSPYGKAEAWLILATRPDACIYFGFSRKVTAEEFRQAVERSQTDKSCMTGFVNRIPVKTGDVFFVPAGLIHAIGAGCLLLEAQEPTDFTIQPEYWCADYALSPQERYLGLAPQDALSCFNHDLYGQDSIRRFRKQPKVTEETDAFRLESLIGPEDTDCFAMDRLTVTGSTVLKAGAAVYVVERGSGTVTCGDYHRSLKQGDFFFLPACAAGETQAQGQLQLVICKGGIPS